MSESTTATTTTTTFGEELRALQVKPASRPLDAQYIESIDTILTTSASFIRESCRRIASMYTNQQATFSIDMEFMTGIVFRCDETKTIIRLTGFNYMQFKTAWKNDTRVRRAMLQRLKTMFGRDMSYECPSYSMQFTINWKPPAPPNPTREPTLIERIDEIKQLILTLPPVAGGHDYVAAAERFAEAVEETDAQVRKRAKK